MIDVEKLSDQWWRLNNLYYVVDEQAKSVLFRPNPLQAAMYRDMHFRNAVLKHRRPGSTTWWCILALDCALFRTNFRVQIIAQDLDKAKEILRDKIEWAYDHLPDDIREARPTTTDRKGELVFSNGSRLAVSTTARSGTVDFLLVTEFGKIAAKRPDVATEIVTGSFPAVAQTGIVVVESTAEGSAGAFYDIVQEAKHLAASRRPLTSLDFKLMFFAWHQDEKNRLRGPEAEHVVINEKMSEYFRVLKAKHGISTDLAQQRWYVTMQTKMKEHMKREYPSTPDEAFEAAIKGAYYATEMLWLREQGRITKVPHQSGIMVDTWWDLDNATTIIFSQTIRNEVHFIDYHHDALGEGLPKAARILAEKAQELGYVYGTHGAPHDIKATELGTGKTRWETAKALGIKFQCAPRPASLSEEDAIEEVRKLLRLAWFDEARCSELIKGLDNYQREWDDRLATFKDHPLHNWASHPADAFRTGASLHQLISRTRKVSIDPAHVQSDNWKWT